MSAPRPRALFVRSLGHSGSTVLELALSALDGTVALGEVGNLVSRFGAREITAACSCGASVDDCVVWGPVVESVLAGGAESGEARYRIAYEAAASLDDDLVLVDNAKTGRWLDAAVATGADVRVLSLTRDVRAWAVARRRRGRTGSGGLRRRVTDSTWFGMRHWYLANRVRDRQLDELDLPTLRVSYEALCADPAARMRSIARFAGLDEPPPDAFADGALAVRGIRHVVIGNQLLRGDAPGAIRYDDRWRDDRSWRAPAAVLRPVMAYNARVVGDSG